MLHAFEPTPGHARRPEDRDPLLGAWLDARFRIEERLAIGGFGAVYRASTAGGGQVAVKVLHPWLTGDANMVARFHREGATMRRLRDRHTVTTLAVGETGDGVRYIAMELLTGDSLHDRLQRTGALAWPHAIAIARAVCSSLAEAHALGVVHRDLKPANIQLERAPGGGDAVKVIDFGIAKLVRGSAADDGRELTYAGHMIGTYEYMSPEQITGEDCRATSDIYALGLLLYEMLAGRRPFPQVTGPAAMMAMLLTQTPAPPSLHVAIPAALDRVVMRCLERAPEDRYASMVEVIAALDAVADGRPLPAARITRAAVTAVTARRDAMPDMMPGAMPDMMPGAMPDMMADALEPPTLVDGDTAWPAEALAQVARRTRLARGSSSELPRRSTGLAAPLEDPPTLLRAPAPSPMLYTTLPGIAVAPATRPARLCAAPHGEQSHQAWCPASQSHAWCARCARPAYPPPAARAAGWPPGVACSGASQAWLAQPLAPASSAALSASCSQPQLRTPYLSSRAVWIALVILSAAAVVLAAVL